MVSDSRKFKKSLYLKAHSRKSLASLKRKGDQKVVWLCRLLLPTLFKLMDQPVYFPSYFNFSVPQHRCDHVLLFSWKTLFGLFVMFLYSTEEFRKFVILCDGRTVCLQDCLELLNNILRHNASNQVCCFTLTFFYFLEGFSNQ